VLLELVRADRVERNRERRAVGAFELGTSTTAALADPHTGELESLHYVAR